MSRKKELRSEVCWGQTKSGSGEQDLDTNLRATVIIRVMGNCGAVLVSIWKRCIMINPKSTHAELLPSASPKQAE